jgi:signal transduction histidine kinase
LVLESLQQTRTLCYTVSPPELEDGLVMGIKALYERLNRLNGVVFNFTEDQALYHVSLDNIDNYNVYRIIQEFSNNSIKHANCSEISCELKLDRNKKSLKILLNDNGNGFDFEKIKYGFGIQNMKKRANLMNAKITITSKIGIGSTLKLSLSL